MMRCALYRNKVVGLLVGVSMVASAAYGQGVSGSKVGTKEDITLWGIPFDDGEVRETLKQKCLADAHQSPYHRDRVEKDGINCVFQKDGGMWMAVTPYGNLSSLVRPSVDANGRLVRFEGIGSKLEMLQLAALLKEKYGEPSIRDEQVTNGVGRKFDKQTFVWTDRRGTVIELESIHSKIDQGRVVIESASFRKAKNVVKDAVKEINKSNL